MTALQGSHGRLRMAGSAFAALVAAIALALAALSLSARTGVTGSYDLDRMVLLHATLPRLAIGLLAGAALGLAGALLQQVLRNPLAEPGTLGVSAGAWLAVTVTTVFVPALAGWGRDLVALSGSGLAAAALFLLTARRGFAPLSLILAGLVLGLWAGSVSAAVILLNDHWLPALYLWGGGALAQLDWTPTVALLTRLAPLFVLAAFLVRSLAAMDLDDTAARAIGLPVRLVRALTVALAVGFAAAVTSSVGVIGFVGLIAPALARALGARRIGARLLWSGALGALLLATTDLGVKALTEATGAVLPTGAATAFLGVPALLFLIARLRPISTPAPQSEARGSTLRRFDRRWAGLALLAIVALAAVTVVVGRAPDGSFAAATGSDLAALLPWRLPRVAAAFGAGALLAVAGTLLQRLTGNEMASPEVTGVGAGAGLGLMAALLLLPGAGPVEEAVAAALGSAAVLAGLLALGRFSAAAPERILMIGIGLTALADALIGMIMATGDPRGLRLLRWMGGSTFGIEPGMALAACGAAVAGTLVAASLCRWLDILPLGPAVSSGIGVPVRRARFAVFGLAAAASAAATLVVGPLSFAGLIAPHIARELGCRRALAQVIGAALTGGTLLALADWLGRMAAFPYQLPAGMVAAVIGAPFLLLLLNRR